MKAAKILGLASIGLFLSALVHTAVAASGANTPLTGTVTETMDSGSYTYLCVNSDGASHWVAASKMAVAVGDTVTVGGGTPMKNFKSPTLHRTFADILFAEQVHIGTNQVKEPGTLPPGHPPISSRGGFDQEGAAVAEITGEVIETMDTGNYTYVHVRGQDRTVWAATERMEVKVGERVTILGGMVVKKFQSPTLNRTFDEIYFTDKIVKEGEAAPALPAGHPATEEHAAAVAGMDVISPPAGGISIADLYARRKDLAGQEVVVKGKVVSYTAQVMGRNWVHLSDGTGAENSRELTLNTSGTTHVGAIVTAKGLLAVDEDLGHGYQYVVLIKDAQLSNE